MKRGWVHAGWLLLPLLGGWVWPGEANRLADEGQAAFDQADFNTAAKRYADTIVATGPTPELVYNLGTAYLRAHDYARAAETLGSGLDRVHDPVLLDRLHYNRGNAYFRLNQLKQAAEEYQRALDADPNDEDAAYNLRLCQQKQNQDNNGGNKGQQNPKNQGGQGQNAGQQGTPQDRQSMQPASSMSESEVDRILQGLAQEERDFRAYFTPRPGARKRSGDPLDPNAALDDSLKQLDGNTRERDW